MAFSTPAHWEAYYSDPSIEHIDWLCQYSTLRKVVIHYLKQWRRPLPSILLLGTGLSTFAEELYDSGYAPITVLDWAAPVEAEHRKRVVDPPRDGIRVVRYDVTAPEWPDIDCEGERFGVVVDKGLIDCVLTSPRGIDHAAAAITNVWRRMTTPGVWISVSHSPPVDRKDMYCLTTAATAGETNVFWHDFQVKRVLMPPLEYASLTAVPGPEKVEDMKPADFDKPVMTAAAAGGSRSADNGNNKDSTGSAGGAGAGGGAAAAGGRGSGGGASGGTAAAAAGGRGSGGGARGGSSSGDGSGGDGGGLAGDVVAFQDDVAYIYILTK